MKSLYSLKVFLRLVEAGSEEESHVERSLRARVQILSDAHRVACRVTSPGRPVGWVEARNALEKVKWYRQLLGQVLLAEQQGSGVGDGGADSSRGAPGGGAPDAEEAGAETGAAADDCMATTENTAGSGDNGKQCVQATQACLDEVVRCWPDVELVQRSGPKPRRGHNSSKRRTDAGGPPPKRHRR